MVQFTDNYPQRSDIMFISWSNFGSKIKFRCGFNCNNTIYNFRSHIHQFTEIVYCKEGSLELTVNGKTETMRPGDMAIIPPYQVHSFHTPKYVIRWICVFSDHFIPKFVTLEQFVSTPKSYVFHPDDSLISFLSDKLPNKRERPIQPSDEEIRVMHLITAAIYEDYLRKTELISTPKENALANILLYIRQHFKEEVTLSSIGTSLGYSPKYVSNCISRIQNYTLPMLVNSLRVDVAKELLVDTDMKVIDIGKECGYNNEKSFYRAFRAITSTTPKDYRLQKRTKNI